MDILPTWVWVVLAGFVLVILAFRIAGVLSDKQNYARDKRPTRKRPTGSPAKTHRTVADKQKQDSLDWRMRIVFLPEFVT